MGKAKVKRDAGSLLKVYLIIAVAVIALAFILLIVYAFRTEIRELGVAATHKSATPRPSEPPTLPPTPTPVPTLVPTPTPTPSPSPTPSPTPTPDGLLGGDYPDRFADTVVGWVTDPDDPKHMTYKSPKVGIEMTTFLAPNGYTLCHMADIYIQDISSLFTVLAYDRLGRTGEPQADMGKRGNALLHINGDFYYEQLVQREMPGLVIRNSTIWLKSYRTDFDLGVLYADGTLETYRQQDVDFASIYAREPLQVWCFGPALLDEQGQPMEKFNSDVQQANPRTAIGYYKPGHYIFLCADGRVDESHVGLTMRELAELMSSLGCKVAYNLDGGQTSMMYADGKLYNFPHKGRRCSDIVLIREPPEATPSPGLQEPTPDTGTQKP